MTIRKARPTTKASTAAPARKKLTLKKDAIKDLSAPARATRQIRGGRSSSGGSIAGSLAGSGI